MKTTREYVNLIDAYHELGSYRAAAELCGATDKTVRRAVERHQAGGPWTRRPWAVVKNTDAVKALIAQRVRETDGRITAKRLLPGALAAGYQGSSRNFRRAVAQTKEAWKRKRRSYRPWVPVGGQHLVIDWGDAPAGLHVFCALLAWSRSARLDVPDGDQLGPRVDAIVEPFFAEVEEVQSYLGSGGREAWNPFIDGVRTRR